MLKNVIQIAEAKETNDFNFGEKNLWLPTEQLTEVLTSVVQHNIYPTLFEVERALSEHVE